MTTRGASRRPLYPLNHAPQHEVIGQELQRPFAQRRGQTFILGEFRGRIT